MHMLFLLRLCAFAVIFLTVVGRAAERLPSSEQVTFNKHIAPLVFERCAGCHHPGEVAPFPLLTYSDVKKRRKQIADVTANHFMPPWKTVEGHGSFLGERRLSKDDVALIGRWVEQGAPEGDARDLPPPPKFDDSGWKLGPPDIVLTMPEPFTVPAEGPDVYRNFVLPLSVPEGKYIKALEYRASNRRVVHHALCATDFSGNSRRADEADPLPGYKGSLNIPGILFPGSLSAWTPGRDPMPLPDGISMPWKKGADLVMQLHLHPSGKSEIEQSSLGFYLTDQPPQRSMIDVGMIDRKIDIPAGERAFKTHDEFTVPVEMHVLGIFPHMHLIGRDMKVTAHPPGGQPFSLLWIDDWDFNWQAYYQYAEPVTLPAGTRVTMDGIHDNSAENVRNPNNPPARVTHGEQTTNEMSAVLMQLVPIRESDLDAMLAANKKRVFSSILAADAAAKTAEKDKLAAAAQAIDTKFLLEKFDKDENGKLDFDELAAATGQDKTTIKLLAALFDKDADGALNPEELSAALAKLRN
jgi:hypothetical protein